MEALSLQRVIHQPPDLQVYERSPIPPVNPDARNAQVSQPHEWPLKKLRNVASDVRDFLKDMDAAVQLLETSSTVFDGIGKHGFDEMFDEYTKDNLEESWHATEYYYREVSAFASGLRLWEEGFSTFIRIVRKRADVPNQLLRRFDQSQIKVHDYLSRVEQSYTVVNGYKTPVFSSILLALAKYRELTTEEKKVLLKSAVFHGPIDNPPSDSRVDWYDDNGR